MKFTKMHGCGNDYVYVNGFEETVQNPEKTAVFMSDRHFGVGSEIVSWTCTTQMDPEGRCAETESAAWRSMFMTTG